MTIPAFDENTRLTDPDVPSDVLVSKQFVTLIELLGEGEIKGFPSADGLTQGTTAYNNAALKDVFLNGTPVLQSTADNSNPADVDFNFSNVSFEPRFGTSNQSPIQAISQTESEKVVSVIVTQDTPVSRDITDTNVNAVRITLSFPSLQKFEDNGDINGAEVSFNIQTISGGQTNTAITDTVRGRAANAYFRDYKLTFSSTTNFPVTIRVNRITADSDDPTKLQNTMLWSSFTEIINDQSSYPNSAYCALRIDSETFSSIPKRMYRVKGTLISIPHNGTVRADGSISYTGTFNGTLKGTKEWTSDPAWILYDLLTTSKGFGDHITASQLDIFSFYSASVYCSELVDAGNGNGSVEPRFSLNTVIQNQKQAYGLINDICSVMRVMPFYSAGTITIGQDRPTDPSYLFNLSNVTEAGFSYANSAKNTKTTVVNVSYFDMETQEINYETTKDDALIAKYGVVTKNLRGFATTSRGMAARLGRWFLYTQSNEAEIVTFTTSLESGVIVRPSQVISIQDPMRAGVRRGGRIKTGVSTTQIIVDDAENTDLTTENNPTLSVILADGSLETRTIQSISDKTITVQTAFSSVPKSNSVWVLENTSISLQTFRVIAVVEVEKIGYQITAVAHNPNKYSVVEDGSPLQTRNITTLTDIKPAPSNLSAVEQIVVINNRAVSKLFLQWQPVAGVTEYQVQYRFNNENFVINNVKSPDFTIFETQNGLYQIRVFSFNALKKPSLTPTTISVTTVGKTALPSDITNLTSEPVSNQFIRLRFDQSTDVDVIHGGNIVVRFTPEVATASATFENSTDVIPALAGNISETLVPALTGTYSVKARDDGGRFSDNEAQIIITAPQAQPLLGIQTRREDTDNPPFQGEKTSVFYESTFDGLLLTGTTLFDAVTDFDALASVDFAGPISNNGTYEFASPLDLGAVFVLNLERHFKTAGLLVNDLFDSRTGLIDTWNDFDGTKANAVNAVLQVATTQENPTTTVAASYTHAGTFVTITKTSHGFSDNDHFIADFTSGSGIDGEYKVSSVTNTNVFVAEKVDSPQQISSSGDVTIGVPFTRFNSFINGETKGRGFKFRVKMSTGDPAQNINVQELGYIASFKPRQENSIENTGATNGVFSSGTNTKTVTFQHPFFVGTVPINGSASKFLPSIGITLQNAQQGDFFTVHTITGINFQIDVRDKDGAFANRNFTYIASGFGKGG
jgi:predicted phage tail protein